MAERCEQCLTEGITLLPKRFGHKFKDKKVEFSVRVLREGYVYILDNNGKWSGFVVTEGRYFKSFTVTGMSNIPPYPNEPDLPYKDSKCLAGDNCQALNSIVRIPNPNKDITTLWVAYSPVKWTKAVMDRHRNNTDNTKTNNMIEVPVSVTQSKSTSSLGTSVSQNGGGYDLLSYNSDEKEEDITYFSVPDEYFGGINPFTKQPCSPDKSNEKENLILELSKIENEGHRVLGVYFNDPIGKLFDLNEFITQFEESIDVRYSVNDIHRLDVAHKIKNIERSIKSGVRSQEINRYIEKKVSAQKRQYTTYRGARGHIEVIDDDKKEALRRGLELTPSEQLEARSSADLEARKAWDDYAELYKKSDMEAYISSGTGKQIQDETHQILETLLIEHKSIYESESYKEQMIYNFDTQNIASGVSYSEKVLESIGTTVNYPEFIKRYADDINNGSLKDDNGYILKALVYNQQSVIDQIIEKSEENIPWSSITQAAWSSIFNGGAALYASNIIKNSAISQNAVAQLSAPLIQVIKEQANKSALSEATYALGFHLQKEITRIDFYGRRYQAISTLSNLIDKQNTSASNSTINRFAISIINQLKVEGNANFQQGVQGHMLALIDMKKAADILNNLELPNSPTGQGKKDRIAVINQSVKPALISGRQAYDIGSNAYKRFVDPHTNPFGSAGKLAIAGGIFQTVACVSLLHSASTGSDSTQSSNVARTIENSEGWSKLAGGLGFLMGGVLDRQANVLRTQLTSPALSDNIFEIKNKQAGTFGKWAGRINVGSGAIFAAFDIYHAYDELNKGNMGTSGLFVISAVSGMGSVFYIGSTATLTAAGVTMSWNLIGWALLAISIGVGIIISIVSNNPLQEWVENSVWGNDAINRGNYEKDIKDYEKVIKEMSE